MADYIERQAVLDAIWPVDPENDGSDGCTVVTQNLTLSSADIEAIVSEIPAADVRENVRATWIKCDYKELDHQSLELVRTGETGVCCSNCRHAFRANMLGSGNFCPNCGARMDGDSNG